MKVAIAVVLVVAVAVAATVATRPGMENARAWLEPALILGLVGGLVVAIILAALRRRRDSA